MKQIRKRLTYANVMSSIAVFLMLGGATAFAATKIGANEIKANSIKTGKIVKEAVTSGKLKNGAVTETKIADGAVTTNKIANDAVTGDKVKESTLSEVPKANTANSATTAGNASSVNGQVIHKLAFRTTSSVGTVGPVSIFNSGGLQILATCTGGNLTLVANTSKQDSSIYVAAIENTTILRAIQESGEFDTGENVDLLAGGTANNDLIHFEYDAVDGTVATGIVNADEDGALEGCRATGDVTVG